MYEVLYHYYSHGNKEIKPQLDWMKNNTPKLLDKANNVKQIMAVEGELWQQFYSIFNYILPEDFTMNKRVKRPPNNPINALISFGNSILYGKTISQLYNTHLDQAISFLHEPSEGRFSLSLDISEVFKPVIVYKTIFECVNRKKLQVDKHFDKELNYCILNELGKKIFISSLEDRLETTFKHNRLKRNVSYQSAIKYDGYKLIKFIMENKEFKPFNIKSKE